VVGVTICRCSHGIQQVSPGDTRFCERCQKTLGYVGERSPEDQAAYDLRVEQDDYLRRLAGE